MDQYMQLLKAPAKLSPISVPTGVCHGRRNFTLDQDSSDDEGSQATGVEYVKRYQEKEMAMYENAMYKAKTATASMPDTVHELLEAGTSNTRSATAQRVYNEYTFIKVERDHLPIDKQKTDILSMLSITNVVVIRGETGCGKTTQVPQFILDDYKARNEFCNIIITQPRKLAAVSVAKRVCHERGWKLGQLCGYQVGLEKAVGEDTILTYVTAGVLLQKLIIRKDLNEFTHIIIDEVHERTQEMDFLLIILRRFLNTNSLGVKIILMSATIDTDKFAYYFRNVSGGLNIPATQIDITKEEMYSKTIHYIEELTNLGEIPDSFDMGTAGISPAIYNIFVRLVLALRHIDDSEEDIGHVLVFLPGIYEIEVAFSLLDKESKKGNGDFFVVPLHSSIPANEQARVFVKPHPGVRKIILSTNIAESSITVPDVVYVIDFCLTKTMVVNPMTQYQTLQLSWASRTNCTQRAGRVGRVRSGRVYRLVTNDFFHHEMPADIPPEMLRAPLERVVLFSKKLELVELPESILGLALDPPDLSNITATIKNLKEAGALLPTCRGHFMEADGDLTMLGNIMCNLPLDVKLAKLICLGYLYSCLDECVIMAAGCSLPNIFTVPFQGPLLSYQNKLIWADGSCSDLIAHYNLYSSFQRNKSSAFKQKTDEEDWCRSNYLSYRSMREWSILINEINARLEHMHIKPEVGPGHVNMPVIERQLVWKIIIAGAFYPNFFTRSSDAGQVDEKEVFRDLKGLNPHNTIYFGNMDMEQPGPLYEERIKEIMRPVSSDISVYFDTTSKVYVTFNSQAEPHKFESDGRKYLAKLPGKVAVDVYKAVRMRQLRMTTSFPIMFKTQAWALAEKLNIAIDNGGYYSLVKQPAKKRTLSVLPSLSENRIFIKISHVIDAGHFFAQPAHEQCSKYLETILNILNNERTPLVQAKREDIEVDGLYAYKYAEDNSFYRCRISGLTPLHRNKISAHILYIDYGNTECVPTDQLYEIPLGMARSIPPQAMECVLSEVRPSFVLSPHGTWTAAADNFFRAQTQDIDLIGEVYSVVNDVVSLKLSRPSYPHSINEQLIDRRYGEQLEESYLSRENNEQRLHARGHANLDEEILDATNPTIPAVHVAAPAIGECRRDVNLRGPFSPLEMKVFPMNRSSERVTIDGTSVNAVLLDTEPQDPHERLLVATYVSKSQHSSVLNLRHTTLMPNIHGLPALIALIFCPIMQLKASEDGSMYVSILCGLGENERKKAIYPEHDLQVVLDVEITKNDLILINEIRFCMNKIIENMQKRCDNQQVPPNRYHWELHERLLKLIKTRRVSQPRTSVKYANCWNKSVFEGTVLNPAGGAFRKDEDVWPLHSIIGLLDQSEDMLLWRRNIDELSEIAQVYKKLQPDTKCLMCDVDLVTLVSLRTHLISAGHKTNVERLNTI